MRTIPVLLLGLSLLQGCAARSEAYAPRAPGHAQGRQLEATVAAPAAEEADSLSANEQVAGMPAPPPPQASPPVAQAPQNPSGNRSDARPEPPRDTGKVQDKRSPILIYTASFRMAVFEVGNSLVEVERLARDVGGFVVKRTDQLVTIRVPASRFYESVGRIEKLGDVTQRDVVAQDVTEEYLDLEIRLRNARAIRDRFEQLLAKANSVQDSLMIERELNRVASEIDRMEGRLKYLRDRAAFSTITVNFDPRRTVAPPPSVRLPFPWLNSSDLSRLLSL